MPLTVISDPVPGKSRALNHGLRKTRGELIVFTDDDVKPDPLWLCSYFRAALENRNYNGFCGRVLPLWEGELPLWLKKGGLNIVPEGVINKRDYGISAKKLPQGTVPGGVNAALRKSMISDMGYFNEEIGPGTDLPYAEDTEFMLRLNNLGQNFYYVPEALVYHINTAERMTIQYAAKWVRQVAKSQIVALHSADSFTSLAGIPKYLFRLVAERGLCWLTAIPHLTRTKRYLDFMQTVGEIQGYYELTHRSK